MQVPRSLPSLRTILSTASRRPQSCHPLSSWSHLPIRIHPPSASSHTPSSTRLENVFSARQPQPRHSLSSWPPPARRRPPSSVPIRAPPSSRFKNSFSSPSGASTYLTPRSRRILALALAALPCGYCYVHADRAPHTGRLRVIDLPRGREHALGAAAYAELLSSRPPGSSAAHARVRRVGARLASAAEARLPAAATGMAWEFRVIHAPDDANAVCCPGGKIAVFSGLLDIARDDDALAAVMAHELSHAIARHSAERISFAKVLIGLQVVLGGIMDFGYLSALMTKVLVDLPYSRTLELEADAIGIELMSVACYDPAASARVFEDLQRSLGSGSGPAERLLSTHPVFDQRIAKLKKLIPAATETRRRSCPETVTSGAWMSGGGKW